MSFQLFLFSNRYDNSNSPFYAFYFFMGQYNSDDRVPSELMGFDCPFDDSSVLQADSSDELVSIVRAAYLGEHSTIEEQVCPDLITDSEGTIMPELYVDIFPQSNFDPDKITYSFGRETLTQFWEREKYRWFP